MTKREEAVAILEGFARGIEVGNWIPNPELCSKLDERYAIDMLKAAPVAIRMAIDILKDPDETSQAAETTDPQ